jgi:hypothetical protein
VQNVGQTLGGRGVTSLTLSRVASAEIDGAMLARRSRPNIFDYKYVVFEEKKMI